MCSIINDVNTIRIFNWGAMDIKLYKKEHIRLRKKGDIWEYI